MRVINECETDSQVYRIINSRYVKSPSEIFDHHIEDSFFSKMETSILLKSKAPAGRQVFTTQTPKNGFITNYSIPPVSVFDRPK